MGYLGNQSFKSVTAKIGNVLGKATVADILDKANSNGDLWIASDTGDLYFNDGTQWNNVGRLKGDTGATGDQGTSIMSVTKTGSEGVIDTYTVLYSNGNTTTFEVRNGSTWITGVVEPTDEGLSGDLYFNTSTNYYYKKIDDDWIAQGTLRGAAFSADAVGTDADKSAHDDEDTGYSYLVLDADTPTVYFKLSSDSGDWDDGTAVGKGDRGVGIASTEFTSTTGDSGSAGEQEATDTYTITYDDGGTDTFTVYNGKDGQDGKDLTSELNTQIASAKKYATAMSIAIG